MLSIKHARHIVEELKSIIHYNINVMDCSGTIIASSNPSRLGSVHGGALQIIQNALPELVIIEDNPDTGVQKGVNLAIHMETKLVGVVGITGDPSEVSILGDIIKRMTEVMLKEMQRQEETDMMDRAKLSFLENWLFASEPDFGELNVRGQFLGFDLSAPYTVAILQPVVRETPNLQAQEDLPEVQNMTLLRHIKTYIKDNSKHFCAVIHNRIIILLCSSNKVSASKLIDIIRTELQRFSNLSICAGISNQTQTPSDIRRCYLEAKTACMVSAQSRGNPILFYDQVSLEFIVQSIPTAIRQDLHNLVFSNCSHEEQKEMVDTIHRFFQLNGDIKACADSLYIHRNSFQYRINRVNRLTGYNLRFPKDSILLYLASQE